jgi:ubiquinone/menaquinone biosynthesis C-methylase UbiE
MLNKKPDFKQDLFEGTSTYYSKYRFPYNKNMIDIIIKTVNIEQNDRLLDLACGPGRITIPLSKYFKEVHAIDWENEMIDEGKKLSNELKIENIIWTNGRAEECYFDPETLKMITIGDAFHRMDQIAILQNSYKMLIKGGYLALIFSDTVTIGNYEWQKELRKILSLYKRPNNENYYNASIKPWDILLKETGFIDILSDNYSEIITLNIEEIIGYLYSMSVYTKNVIGEKYELFENSIKEKLLKIIPDNKFKFNYSCGYILGKKE